MLATPLHHCGMLLSTSPVVTAPSVYDPQQLNHIANPPERNAPGDIRHSKILTGGTSLNATSAPASLSAAVDQQTSMPRGLLHASCVF